MFFRAAYLKAFKLVSPNLKRQLCKISLNRLNGRHFSHKFVGNNFIVKQNISSYQIINKAFTNNNDESNNIKKLGFTDFKGTFTLEEENSISKNMIVVESFISKDEEECLLKEIEPYMKRLRYESSHWDDAIHEYRETERLKWNEENTKIINRVRNFAFLPDSPTLSHVHILDLAENGYIKPHIDAVRFCGNTIAGLSLLTDAVMRLVHEKDKTKIVDVLLRRRSLYVMRDCVRYDYTHEILAKPESKFKGEPVEKKRRISVICRNEPTPTVKEPNF